jgi:hypothetical protein
MAEDNGVQAYVLGRTYSVMPIEMVPEACTAYPAGPVTFVVEERRLDDEAILASASAQGRLDAVDTPDGVDDGGPSLHVLGTDDGLEHLRFDCFEREPHYHYIRQAEQANVVVRIDTHAEGDPLAWALSVVGSRLPEMLDHAGAGDLAAAVRSAPEAVASGLAAVVERLQPTR